MVLTGTEAIVYLYVLNDRTQKFDVSKVEYRKGGDKYKIMNDNENEVENENEIQENQENQEIQENQESHEQPEMQEPPQEEQNQQVEEQEQ